MSFSTIAPGVYSRIIDKSLTTPVEPGTVGLFFFASDRGIDNELLPITSDTVFKFGTPNLKRFGQALNNLYSFLSVSGRAWGMRVLPTPEMDVNFLTNPDPSFPAKYSHVIFGYTVYTDANGVKHYGIFPIYLDPVDAANVSNVLDDINGNTMVTKFAKQLFLLPNNEYVKTNAYSVIENPIELSTDRLTLLNNDTALKSTWLPTSYDIASYNSTYYDGFTITSPYTPFMIVIGKGRGDFYNNLYFSIVRSATDPEVYIFNVILQTPVSKSVVESFKISFKQDKVDTTGESMYIDHVINKYSDYVTVYTNPDVVSFLVNTLDPTTNKPILDTVLERTFFIVDETNNVVTERQQVQLKYGTNGKLFNDKGIIDYSVYETCLIYALTGELDDKIYDTEEMDASLIFDANFSINVKNRIIELCEKRQDLYAVLDVPISKDANDAVNIVLNQMTSTASIFASQWVPFSTIYEDSTGQYVKVAPSYHLARIIPQNDKERGVWESFSGLRKPHITSIVKLDYNPVKTEDLEVLFINKINPIVKKQNTYIAYGNLNTTRTDSILSNINVVRLIIYIDRILKKYVEQFEFENNDPVTWMEVRNGVNDILSNLKSQGALRSYDIDVGANSYELKHNEMHVNISIVPVTPILRIYLTYTITNS